MNRHRRVAPLVQLTSQNGHPVSRKPVGNSKAASGGGAAESAPATGTVLDMRDAATASGRPSHTARKTSFLNPMQKRLLEATLFGNASRNQTTAGASADRAQPADQQQTRSDSATSSTNEATDGSGSHKCPPKMKLEETKKNLKFGLVVDGTTLDLLLKPTGAPLVFSNPSQEPQSQASKDSPVSDEGRELFLDLAERCESVVCCRASPAQKEIIVDLVSKHSGGRRTLAIGDGSNDVWTFQLTKYHMSK